MLWSTLALCLLGTTFAQGQTTTTSLSSTGARQSSSASSSSTTKTTSSSISSTATTTISTISSSASSLVSSTSRSSSSSSSSSIISTVSSSSSTTSISVSSSSTSNTTTSSSSTPTASSLPAVAGKNLRILPLGDSITHGYGSTTGNGYRYTLYQMLSTNNTISFVGGVQWGNISTPFSEGHDGAYIQNISYFAKMSGLPRRPNVILLHAGTNDVYFQNDPPGAPARLSSLIDQIFGTCPDATVLVAQIVPAGNDTANQRISTYNNAVAGIVSNHLSSGQRVLLVDHYTPMMNFTGDDLYDGLHPDDSGYSLMGKVWYQGLQQAAAKGWLDSTPVSTSNLAPVYKREICTSNPVWQWTTWIHDSPGLGPSKQAGINCTSAGASSCFCSYFDGTNRTLPLAGSDCSLMSTTYFQSVQMVDLNNDGLADYLFIKPDASVYAALASSSGWNVLPNFACCTGARPEEIVFVDIDGNGAADYVWIHPDGSVEAWLNTIYYGWNYIGVISPARPNMPGAGIRFADLDNDGMAELLYIDPTNGGQVTAFKNNGSPCGFSCQGSLNWTSLGILVSSGGTRDSQIYIDLNGDGYADYLQIDRNSGALTVFWSWYNTPWAAGQYIYWPGGQVASGFGAGFDASSIIFADTTGDGRTEYLFVPSNDGNVFQFLNWC